MLDPDGAFDDVPHQLPAVAVAEGAGEIQFPGFGDVVQENPRHHQVAVEAGIKTHDGVGDFNAVERVFQQSANEGVMKTHRRRGLGEFFHQLGVVEIGLDDGRQMAVLNALQNFRQLAAHLRDVARGMRDQVADLEGSLLGGPGLFDDELEIVLVILDAPRSLTNPPSGRALKMSRVAFQ